MKNLILSLALLVSFSAFSENAPETVIVTESPILDSYSDRDGWMIKMEEAEIRQGTRAVKFSGNSVFKDQMGVNPEEPFERRALYIYLPARSVSLQMLKAVFLGSGKFSLRITGKPTRTNILEISQPPALVGSVPAGRFKVDTGIYIPYYRFDGELKVEVTRNTVPVDALKIPTPVLFSPTADRPSERAPKENIMTIFTPVPKLLGIENGFLRLQADHGEIGMGSGGGVEFSPQSFLSDSSESLSDRLNGLEFLIPATAENVEAVFKVFKQKQAGLMDRNLGLLIRGLPLTGNVGDILPAEDSAGRLRSHFVTVESQTPRFGFAADVSVKAVQFVHADRAANDQVTAPSRKPSRKEMCDALLRAQKREGVRFGPMLIIDNDKK